MQTGGKVVVRGWFKENSTNVDMLWPRVVCAELRVDDKLIELIYEALSNFHRFPSGILQARKEPPAFEKHWVRSTSAMSQG